MLGFVNRVLHPERRLIDAVRAQRLTYLHQRALADLWTAVRDVERRNVPGVILEAGCALGGSTVVIAAAKARRRPFRAYDVFGMIPPPSERDGEDVHERYEKIVSGQSVGIQGDAYYGYQDGLRERVAATITRFGYPPAEHAIQLVEGLFQDSLVVEEPVALAHLDGDWYESTMTCLTRIGPHLSPGGRFIIDDYEAWSGCRTAVDEYLAAHPGSFDREQHKRLHLVRPG